jgi:hypothetical protein
MFDVDYLKYFMACELSGNEDPVCLILDKNYSQLSIATISVAKNDIYLLTLPSHTTHKLRPLNCTICGPFGTYGNIRLNDWILSNLSKLQHSTVFQLLFENFFGKSFIKLKTGIFCSTWWALRDIWMSPLHWIRTLPKMTRSGRAFALQIRLIQGWDGMAVKIENVSFRRAKVQLDTNPWISPTGLSYFLFPVRLRRNCRNYQWARKLFRMIRSLDAQRMPHAVCLWEITGEAFKKSNSESAADPVKLDLLVRSCYGLSVCFGLMCSGKLKIKINKKNNIRSQGIFCNFW